jgi:hypothetical protein
MRYSRGREFWFQGEFSILIAYSSLTLRVKSIRQGSLLEISLGTNWNSPLLAHIRSASCFAAHFGNACVAEHHQCALLCMFTATMSDSREGLQTSPPRWLHCPRTFLCFVTEYRRGSDVAMSFEADCSTLVRGYGCFGGDRP